MRLARPHVEAQRHGDLVCLDAFYIGKLTGVGKVWQLTACDAACLYGVATLVPQVAQEAPIQFLRTHLVPSYQHAGQRVRAVLTVQPENGANLPHRKSPPRDRRRAPLCLWSGSGHWAPPRSSAATAPLIEMYWNR
ncbi:MAG TPA: hypothetical protein VEP50_19295 [bacterium]|nr:hypothetical protein [bacterium]